MCGNCLLVGIDHLHIVFVVLYLQSGFFEDFKMLLTAINLEISVERYDGWKGVWCMLEYVPLWWLIAIILFCVGEAATVQLFFIWFGAGALLALIAAMLGASVWLQLVIFFVSSAILLIVTRPLAKKVLNLRKTATNADMVVGSTGLVQESVSNLRQTGRVYVNGLSWAARSVDDSELDEGQKVVVVRIEGVKVFVQPAED